MLRWSVALVLFVCGIQSVWADNRAQVLYGHLPSTELTLSFSDPITGEPLVGSSTYQKSISGLICRKTLAVIPNAVPSYNCWVKTHHTAAQSGALYNGLNVSALRVDFGIPITGSTLLEKDSAEYFCQKQTPVVPQPVSSYSCWRNLAYVK
jgi:hypothetical protein